MANIVEILLDEKLLTKEDVSKLLLMRPPRKITLESFLAEEMLDKNTLYELLAKKVKQGVLTLVEIDNLVGLDTNIVFERIAKLLNLTYIDLDKVDIDMHLYYDVPYQQLARHNALPIEETPLNIVVVFQDPFDMMARDAIQRLYHKKAISVALSRPKKIALHIGRLETSNSIKGLIKEIRDDLKEGGSEKEGQESPAVLKLIDLILNNAISIRGSDIHIEATEKNCMVRVRVDGMLSQSFIFDKDIFSPLSSRMKLLSNLDIAEKRKPQDGRFSAKVSGKEFDFRVSTLPTIFGESIVLRILDKSKAMISLEDAGMSEECYNKFSQSIKSPYGIVLVTGPTGSGKTTTLYGALNAIRDIKDKTITVEDPVEYQMGGIQQVQVRSSVGLSFADALRSILRQDPDKIMIGEIRDAETLRIAIQAALTGHLVLSTLHTNDAISAVSRILDMGIESYLVSGALVAIQAQRLVRKICPHCRVEASVSSRIMQDIGEYLPDGDEFVFYRGEGCEECHNSGYFGREMISEVFPISEKMSRMIAKGASKEEMIAQASEEGFVNMFADGISKALKGYTTVDEILRVVRL